MIHFHSTADYINKLKTFQYYYFTTQLYLLFYLSILDKS